MNEIEIITHSSAIHTDWCALQFEWNVQPLNRIDLINWWVFSIIEHSAKALHFFVAGDTYRKIIVYIIR